MFLYSVTASEIKCFTVSYIMSKLLIKELENDGVDEGSIYRHFGVQIHLLSSSQEFQWSEAFYSQFSSFNETNNVTVLINNDT